MRMSWAMAGAAVVSAILAAPARAQSMDEQLTQLFLSSAWCTFKYNQVTGASRSERYRFFENGTYEGGSTSESYSSGRGGSVAGQTNSGGSGRWGIQNGMLFLSEGHGPMQPAPFTLKRSSSGGPVIVSDGKEYSQCR